MDAQVIVLLVLPLLAWAALSDLCSRRVPNLVCAGVVLSWLAHQLADGSWAQASGDLLRGVGVLAAGLLVWRFGHLGGGDVKLTSAVTLWAGGALLLPFLFLTALLGGALAVAWLAAVRSGLLPAAAGVLARLGLPAARLDAPDLPYGVAVSASGLWLVSQRFWM